MAYGAKVLADSVSPAGHRLTTLEVTMPRIVLAELNTHRTFSRSSASSRAVPVEKRIQSVLDDPFVPDSFGRNQKGMQAATTLDGMEADRAREIWVNARNNACEYAQQLAKLGVHKQLANRLLDLFLWHVCVISATEWGNFFGLRISEHAQPEIRRPAELMKQAIDASSPLLVEHGGWHTPLVPDRVELEAAGYSARQVAEISAARCARVSYLTHDGKRDPTADLALYQKLVSSGHMSPLEHVAMPSTGALANEFTGNFFGWFQLRKSIPGEQDFSLRSFWAP